jgi:AcrR family transcriptional regulator
MEWSPLTFSPSVNNMSNYSYSQLAFRNDHPMRQHRPLNPRKQPSQRRSRETVAVILEAAARILEKDGLAGFNTNAVAERAGVSIGSVYQYFPNKDALILALIAKFEHELLETVRKAAKAARGRGLPTTLNLFVRALLEAHGRRAELNRLLEAEEERLRPHLPVHNGKRELNRILRSILVENRAGLSVAINSSVVEDLIIIARAMSDAVLLGGTPPAAAQRRVFRALWGYLCSG